MVDAPSSGGGAARCAGSNPVLGTFKGLKYGYARVAKLVDAADSKSAVRKDVLVRFLSWAQKPPIDGGFFLLLLVFIPKH